MITHSQARNLAEARWGRGGTSSEKTGIPGVFYFSCSGHGGFIIDGTTHQLTGLQPTPITVIISNSGKVIKARPPESNRSLSYYSHHSYAVDDYPVYYAEEDCDWCHPVLEIEKLWPDRKAQAQRCFYTWFDPTNPAVIERKRQDEARRNNDPDLITWATPTEIGTADGATHPIPDGYSYTNPWRSAYQ